MSETARLERIVSKRKDSAYRSGRSPDWLKMKNADAPAVKRGVQGKRAAGRVAGVERDVVKRESDYARPTAVDPEEQQQHASQYAPTQIALTRRKLVAALLLSRSGRRRAVGIPRN